MDQKQDDDEVRTAAEKATPAKRPDFMHSHGNPNLGQQQQQQEQQQQQKRKQQQEEQRQQ